MKNGRPTCGRLPCFLPVRWLLAFLFSGEEDFGITLLEQLRKDALSSPGGMLNSVREEETCLFFGKQDVDSVVETLKRFEYFDELIWSAESALAIF